MEPRGATSDDITAAKLAYEKYLGLVRTLVIFHGKEKVRSSPSRAPAQGQGLRPVRDAAGIQVRTNGVPGWTGIGSPFERRVLQ